MNRDTKEFTYNDRVNLALASGFSMFAGSAVLYLAIVVGHPWLLGPLGAGIFIGVRTYRRK